MDGAPKGLIAYRKEVNNDRRRVGAKPSKKSSEKYKRKCDVQGQHVTSNDRICCGCGGCEHECFSNCMGCGRILCIKEGEGPCFHCGTFVFSPSDTSKIPKEYLDDPEFMRAIELRDRLLAMDSRYVDDVLKVQDLNSDWFREANNIYNDNPEYARRQYYEEEHEKRLEAGIQRYDLDLGTGTIKASVKPDK